MNYSNLFERGCLEHEMRIISVCFNEKCQANRLLCVNCIQYHTAHANRLYDINTLPEHINILIFNSEKILNCFNVPIDNIIINIDQLKNIIINNRCIFVAHLNEENYYFDKKCSKHNSYIIMICKKAMCNSNQLVCCNCLDDHRNHCLLDRENFKLIQDKIVEKINSSSNELTSKIDNFSIALAQFKKNLNEKYSITLENFMNMTNGQMSFQLNLFINFIDRNQKDFYQNNVLFLLLISNKMEQFSKLIKAPKQSIRLIEKYLEQSRKQGEVLRVLVKYQESFQKQDKVLLNHPNDKVIFWGKGEALRMLGQYLKSIQWFDKALAIDPQHVYSLWGKGEALWGVKK